MRTKEMSGTPTLAESNSFLKHAAQHSAADDESLKNHVDTGREREAEEERERNNLMPRTHSDSDSRWLKWILTKHNSKEGKDRVEQKHYDECCCTFFSFSLWTVIRTTRNAPRAECVVLHQNKKRE